VVLLDILLSLTVILYLSCGEVALTVPRLATSIILLGVGLLVLHTLGAWLAGRLVVMLHRAFSRTRLDSRRRIQKNGQLIRTRAEARLEAMDEKTLRAHIEAHPKDSLACEILCERLKGEGRLTEYAREMEYFLNLPSDLTIEEKCTRYHALADLYANTLDRPERAEEILRTLIASFPRHYQATLARRRLERMHQSKPSSGASS
jgi:hypothetical protein